MDNSREEKLALVELQASQQSGLDLAVQLKAKDAEAVRKARNWLQSSLLFLLSFEIFFVAYVMISQGVHLLLFTKVPFQLSEWGFVPFVNVALIQTCILIRPIANNLFPINKVNEKINKN